MYVGSELFNDLFDSSLHVQDLSKSHCGWSKDAEGCD